MQKDFNMKRLGITLAIVIVVPTVLWVGTAQVIGAKERLTAQTQIQAQEIADTVQTQPVVAVNMQCGDKKATSVQDVKPGAISGEMIVKAVPEGCKFEGAEVNVKTGGAPLPQQVKVEAAGVSGTGTVSATKEGEDLRITVDTQGQTTLFRKSVEASGSAVVQVSAAQRQAEVNLRDAVATAAPVMVEKSTGTAPATVVVEEAPPAPAPAPATAPTPAPVPQEKPTTVQTKPTAQPVTTVSSTPDASWWNEETLRKFSSGPQTTRDPAQAEANANARRKRPPGK